MSSVPHILEGAKKALESANKFTNSVTGGKPSAFAPKEKPQTEKADYAHARSARKSAGSFMGVRSDQGPELKAAEQSHAEAEKALHPNY